MKYNVLSFITNTQNQYSASVVATYDNIDGAKVNYHQTLASLHNASDVKVATVKILDEFGHELSGFSETVDHTQTEEAETE